MTRAANTTRARRTRARRTRARRPEPRGYSPIGVRRHVLDAPGAPGASTGPLRAEPGPVHRWRTGSCSTVWTTGPGGAPGPGVGVCHVMRDTLATFLDGPGTYAGLNSRILALFGGGPQSWGAVDQTMLGLLLSDPTRLARHCWPDGPGAPWATVFVLLSWNRASLSPRSRRALTDAVRALGPDAGPGAWALCRALSSNPYLDPALARALVACADEHVRRVALQVRVWPAALIRDRLRTETTPALYAALLAQPTVDGRLLERWGAAVEAALGRGGARRDPAPRGLAAGDGTRVELRRGVAWMREGGPDPVQLCVRPPRGRAPSPWLSLDQAVLALLHHPRYRTDPGLLRSTADIPNFATLAVLDPDPARWGNALNLPFAPAPPWDAEAILGLAEQPGRASSVVSELARVALAAPGVTPGQWLRAAAHGPDVVDAPTLRRPATQELLAHLVADPGLVARALDLPNREIRLAVLQALGRTGQRRPGV